MIFSHKIALVPNNKQATYLTKASGVSRFAYNWALVEWKKQYEAGEKPSVASLDRRLNASKYKQFPWMEEITACVTQKAVMCVGEAFKNFFAGRAKYPVFHKKGVRDSFYISNQKFKLDDKRIRIPKLGWVKMREPLRFEGKIMSATVSRTADKWFVSITVDCPSVQLLPHNVENQDVVGVDLGLTTLATLSSGEKVAGPKSHKRLLSRIRRLSQSLSRKVKGSANYKKARIKLARLHMRVANIRNDALHKLTTDLVKRFAVIGIEDLAVKNMIRSRRLARSLSDASFGEFRRQLEYKATKYQRKLVVADRFFASSKLCSTCGYKLDQLSLSTRSWKCPECGVSHDRDVNAAINLRVYAEEISVLACGEEGAGLGLVPWTKSTSMKQEFNSNRKDA